jgi:hypothetical protein
MWAERAMQRAEPGAYFIQDQIKGEPWAVLLCAVQIASQSMHAERPEGEA